MKCSLFDLIPCYAKKLVDEDFFEEHGIEGVTLEEYNKMRDYIFESVKELKLTEDDFVHISDIYRLNRFNKEDLMVALVVNEETAALHRLDTSEIDRCKVVVDANSKINMHHASDVRDAKINELKLAYSIQYFVDAYNSNTYAAMYDKSYICVSEEVKDEKFRKHLAAEVEPGNKVQYDKAIETLRRIKNQYTQRRIVLSERYSEEY